MSRTAAALVIGNEILTGKVQDANTVILARELRALGIELARVVTVPDEIDVIAAEVNALRNAYDLLFTSGGVGPTHDDVTIAAIGRALGRPVVRDTVVESILREFYGERCTPDHLRMADLVEGTELALTPEAGTWPTFVLGNVYILPGIPELFRLKLAVLRERHGGGDGPFVSRAVYTRGDEGEIKRWIDAVVTSYPDVMVGSYPKFRDPDYNVKVTFDGRVLARIEAATASFAQMLPAALLVRIE